MKYDRTVRTTCPYCGVGCQIELNIKDERIISVGAPIKRKRILLNPEKMVLLHISIGLIALMSRKINDF